MYPNYQPNMMPTAPLNNQQNQIINQFFGNVQNFQNSLNNAIQQVNQMRINPRMQVQGLLNSGRMTQEGFNQYRNIANQIMGTNY